MDTFTIQNSQQQQQQLEKSPRKKNALKTASRGMNYKVAIKTGFCVKSTTTIFFIR